MTTSIATVTERALQQNRLTLDQVRAMAESESALNPLSAQTPHTDRLALRDFFDRNLPLADWARVRRELGVLLARYGVQETIRDDARTATAVIWSPKKVREFQGKMDNVHTFRSSKGRTVVSFILGRQVTVYEVGTDKLLWSGSGADSRSFSEDEAGGLHMAISEEIPFDTDDFARHVRRRKVTSVDLQTHERTEKTLEYPELTSFHPLQPVPTRYASTHDGVDAITALQDYEPQPPGVRATKKNLFLVRGNLAREFHPIISRPLQFPIGAVEPRDMTIRELANGKVVVTGGVSHKTPGGNVLVYFPPFGPEPSEPELIPLVTTPILSRTLEITRERFVVAVDEHDEYGDWMEIFDPVHSGHKAVFRLPKELDDSSRVIPFVFQGQLMALASRSVGEGTLECRIFLGEEPVRELAVFHLKGNAVEGVVGLGDDQVALFVNTEQHKVELYHLRQKTRGE